MQIFIVSNICELYVFNKLLSVLKLQECHTLLVSMEIIPVDHLKWTREVPYYLMMVWDFRQGFHGIRQWVHLLQNS